MGKRNKGKKKVSKGALKRQREQEAKIAALQKEQEEKARAEAIARGEDPDQIAAEKAAKKAAKEKKQQQQNQNDEMTMNVEEEDGPKEWTRDILVHNFTLAPVDGGTPLIHKAELKILHGHRYGLIGKNGAGKSTMLNRLDRKEFDNFPSHLRVHLVEQEMEGTDMTVLETVQASDIELTSLLNEKVELMRILEAPDRLLKEEREAMKEAQLSGLQATKEELLQQKAELGKDASSETKEEELPAATQEEVAGGDEDEDYVKLTDLDVIQAKIDEVDGKIAALDTADIPLSDARKAAIAQVETVPPLRVAEIDERLHYLEADQAETRASEVLSGLGFTERMQNMKTIDLSGGWRMRVALACGLFIEPDILLLDEPTNHLDFPTVCWLSEYLQAYNADKIIIIVSHEREFMNEVVTDIIHLHRCKLVYYKGNYAQFAKTRAEHRRHQAVQYKKQQREIAHQQDFIRRFAANKKWSTQAQSRRKVLAKMKRVEAVYNERDWSFRFPVPEKLKNELVLDVEDMGFSYFGGTDKKKFLLRDVNCRITMGKKIGLIGANGAGKSTMLKLIMKELNPLEGKCFMRNQVTHSYFAQHHLETIDLDATPLQFLRAEFTDTSLQDCFARLGRFNITPKDARKKICMLSGGEKSRLAFCILTWYTPHLVIMDEPTNHLDIQTQDALVDALKDYKGSLLVVSHDKHLLTNTCDEFWVIGNQTLTAFDNFDKATRFCYKKCKPVDVLPREFSKVSVKARKDIGKRAKEVDPANILAGDNLKKPKKDKEDDTGFIIDADRMIRRSIEKGLEPKKYIVHLKGWSPTDGEFSCINIVGFDMMNKFLTDPAYGETDHFEFFESYQPLIEFLVPPECIQLQIQLLKNMQSAWWTARGENFERARDEDSLMEILECFYQFQYITDEALFAWKNLSDDTTIGREESMQLLWEFFEGMEPPEQDEEEVDAAEGVEVAGDASSI